jgi:death-on-curing protein
MIQYLSAEQVIALHGEIIRVTGGSPGVGDRAGLEAAIARPAMTFAGQDLYATLPAKAAALMHTLIANHAFVDGNKRIGAASAELLLIVNGWQLVADDAEVEHAALAVARGERKIEELTIWFDRFSVRADPRAPM